MPQLSWLDISRQVSDGSAKVSRCRLTQPEDCRSMAFTLNDLNLATDYEAVVKVKNIHGWSPDSDMFLFSTRKGL